MTPKPESETDPWARLRRFHCATTYQEMLESPSGSFCLWAEADAVRAAEAAQHRQEIAAKDETIGRWTQTGLTLMKFFGAAPRMAEADMPDFLWREVPALIRSLRNTLREANAENATLRAQVETLTAERDRWHTVAKWWADQVCAAFDETEHWKQQSASLAAVEGELVRFKAAFFELHATVTGECPSLLDPCRGGSDVLRTLCDAALTSPTQETNK